MPCVVCRAGCLCFYPLPTSSTNSSSITKISPGVQSSQWYLRFATFVEPLLFAVSSTLTDDLLVALLAHNAVLGQCEVLANARVDDARKAAQAEGHVKVASFGQKTWERRRLACIGAGRLPALPGNCWTLT
jgi:hypothetical protein